MKKNKVAAVRDCVAPFFRSSPYWQAAEALLAAGFTVEDWRAFCKTPVGQEAFGSDVHNNVENMFRDIERGLPPTRH